MKKRSISKNNSVFICIVAVIIALVALLLFFMRGRETRNSDGDTAISIGVLTCTGGVGVKDPFFKESGEIDPVQKVKVTFRNGKYDIFDFTYDAKFNSESKSKEALGLSRARYNIYMAGYGFDPEDLSPTFSRINSELIINLYIERKNLTQATGELVFLDEKDFVAIDGYDVDGFKRMYAGKGFTCQYSE